MRTTRTDIYQMLGKFWRTVWHDEAYTEALTAAWAEGISRLEGRRTFIAPHLSRLAVPLYFVKHLQPFDLRENDLEEVVVPVGSFTVGDGTHVGDLLEQPREWRVACPAASCELILDTPVGAAVALQKNINYRVDNGYLYFYSDPMDSGFTMRLASDGGTPERVCRLWLCEVDEDLKGLTDFHGIYFGVNAASSIYYRRLTNAIWDLYVEGASMKAVAAFLAAYADSDICAADGVVEAIWTEGGRWWLSTGDDLYSCPDTTGIAPTAYVAGDAVAQGDILFTTVTLNRGTDTMTETELPLFCAGSGFISAAYKGGLVFQNKDCTIYDEDFPIGGHPDTVAQYRLDIAAAFAAKGLSLRAALSGGRPPPWTVNPFTFAIQPLLKNNTFFFSLDYDAVPDNAPELGVMRHLDNTVPAGTTYAGFVTGDWFEEDVDSGSCLELEPLAEQVGLNADDGFSTATDYNITIWKPY